MERRVIRLCAMGAALALCLASTSGARSDFVVYNNFGASDAYNTNVSWTVGNPGTGQNFVPGDSFTPTQSGTLSKIVIALEWISGPNTGTVSLEADAGGLPSGTVLESFSVSSLPPFDGSFHTPLTLTDTINAPLVAGTTYWIVASTTAGSLLGWNENSTSATGSHAESSDGGSTWSTSTNTQGAFRVTENLTQTAVPEPSSLALLGIGLGVLAGHRLRRRQG